MYIFIFSQVLQDAVELGTSQSMDYSRTISHQCNCMWKTYIVSLSIQCVNHFIYHWIIYLVMYMIYSFIHLMSHFVFEEKSGNDLFQSFKLNWPIWALLTHFEKQWTQWKLGLSEVFIPHNVNLIRKSKFIFSAEILVSSLNYQILTGFFENRKRRTILLFWHTLFVQLVSQKWCQSWSRKFKIKQI